MAAEYQLVISDPPHRGEVDAAACSALVGRSAGEVRGKAAQPCPDVIFGSADPAEAARVSEGFAAAGMNVFAVSGAELIAVPVAMQAERFEFTEGGIVFELPEGSFELAPPRRLFIVSCRPKLPVGQLSPNGFLGAMARGLRIGHASSRGLLSGMLARARASAQIEAERARRAAKDRAIARKEMPPYLAFLDIYFGLPGGFGRITVVEGAVDYSGLGTEMTPMARENSRKLLARIRDIFGEPEMDKRLENWHYRPSTLGGLFLNRLLESVEPALKDLDPYDLGSRLCFLSALRAGRVAALPAEAPPAPRPPRADPRSRKLGFD